MANAFDIVLKELGERKSSLTTALVSGAAKDYAEYKYLTGEFRGLSLAEQTIKDLVRQMENDDE